MLSPFMLFGTICILAAMYAPPFKAFFMSAALFFLFAEVARLALWYIRRWLVIARPGEIVTVRNGRVVNREDTGDRTKGGIVKRVR